MNGTLPQAWMVVEDDEDDYWLFGRACRSLPHCPTFLWFRDGVDAQDYLKEPSHTIVGIISDLKMPRMNGLELLRWVRSHEALSQVRFFILSNSSLEKDVQHAFDAGAHDYQVKPGDAAALSKVLRTWIDPTAPRQV